MKKTVYSIFFLCLFIYPLGGSSHCVMHVFIHGTQSSRYIVNRVGEFLMGEWMSQFLQVIYCQKDKGGRMFAQYKEKILHYIDVVNHNNYYNFQPLGSAGFQEIDMHGKAELTSFAYVSFITSLLYEHLYDLVFAGHADTLVFRSYNWNGFLSAQDRLDAARLLYAELLQDAKQLQYETGLPVKIHLLAHSHGCNVVLNLAAIEQDAKQGLRVDRALLFAGPVQSETERYIHSDIFGSIYNIYSKGDLIQVLDCVSTKDFFSRRIFKDVPDNVKQIEVEVDPHKPTHYEMWFWGCGQGALLSGYRKTFSLNPFPVSIFAPIIMHLADTMDSTCKLGFKRDTFSLVCGSKKADFTVDFGSLQDLGMHLCRDLIKKLTEEGLV